MSEFQEQGAEFGREVCLLFLWWMDCLFGACTLHFRGRCGTRVCQERDQRNSAFLTVFASSSRCERGRGCGGVTPLLSMYQICRGTRLLRDFVKSFQIEVVVSSLLLVGHLRTLARTLAMKASSHPQPLLPSMCHTKKTSYYLNVVAKVVF